MGKKSSRKTSKAYEVSSKEKAAVNEYLRGIKIFRKECPELNEGWCLKFLEVNNYDVKKSIAHFKSHVEWRLEASVGRLQEGRLFMEQEMWSYWPQYYLGRDRESHPVLYMRLADFDVTAMMSELQVTIEDILMFHVKQQEFLRLLAEEASLQEGRPISEMVCVIDATGASMSTHLSTSSREFFSKLVSTDSRNYPNSLAKLLIINTSMAFPVIWSFAKNLVDPKTRKRIEVFGSGTVTDNTGWPKYLRELLGVSVLPKQLNADRRLKLPSDKRLPTESPPWSVLHYLGPASSSSSSVSQADRGAPNRGSSHGAGVGTRKGRRDARWEDDDDDFDNLSLLREAPDGDGRMPNDLEYNTLGTSSRENDHSREDGSETDCGMSVSAYDAQHVAHEALKACLEAEGLTGAVQLKQNPAWQCIHCKREFPLHMMAELQEHENECARKAASNVAQMKSNPTQDWFNQTQHRSRNEEYRSSYQMGQLPRQGRQEKIRVRMGACCGIQ